MGRVSKLPIDVRVKKMEEKQNKFVTTQQQVTQ